jgi:prepilin-type N-terminal cleavage/methylation domain-containing protein
MSMTITPGTKNHGGFTLIELMVVIGVIGILAAIAIPSFLVYKTKAYDGSANHDIKNAYIAAQNYFIDYDNGLISDAALASYGYRPTKDVVLTIVDASIDGLSMTSSHEGSSRTYSVDASGRISY